jgi:CheY-like chemotaxis protein
MTAGPSSCRSPRPVPPSPIPPRQRHQVVKPPSRPYPRWHVPVLHSRDEDRALERRVTGWEVAGTRRSSRSVRDDGDGWHTESDGGASGRVRGEGREDSFRILVVDDDPEMRRLLAEFPPGKGFVWTWRPTARRLCANSARRSSITWSWTRTYRVRAVSKYSALRALARHARHPDHALATPDPRTGFHPRSLRGVAEAVQSRRPGRGPPKGPGICQGGRLADVNGLSGGRRRRHAGKEPACLR